jgi:hypothetical protein
MDKAQVKYLDRQVYVQCEFEGMVATLSFDDILGLTEVHQYKTFGIHEKQDADNYAKEIFSLLEKKYGKPSHQKDDNKKGKKRFTWITDYTLVILYYNYKQGETEDELGKNVYSFKIEYRPI